ncbi:MAG: acylneuraminate cytidylyltransferase family protein [Proteobacteria bacterium]|nr:acylneuraminate cytidylyltransferase family protein [Pseudomonadota bacterium]
MKTIALILARGGSKEIPRKNIQPLSGEPLISYAINSAKWSRVDEVWVSTDSSSIKNISEGLGAKVIDRPSEFATDESASEDALLHFAENVDFDILVFVQPTSPLLRPSYINEGLEKMKEYDSVFSVYEEHWLPRWDLQLNPIGFDNYSRPRRQDRESVYVENGAFYITTKDKLLESKTRISGNIGIVKMKMQDSFQIDTQDDLDMVEKFL